VAEESTPVGTDGVRSISHDDPSEAHGLLEARLSEDLAPDLHVTRSLGRSAVAEVFLAREPGLKRLVAVKVLSPGLADDQTAMARFAREAQAAAGIVHPNVVTVHRVGHLSDGLPYLVMQYVEGRSLAARLRAEGPFSIPEACRILADVASALAAVHQRRIVHRDLKPENVLVEEGTRRVFVTDFGIAAILISGAEEPRRLTTVGHAVGDLRYMSPERLRGEEATERADIYSLGLLGYDLLTGCGPCKASSNREWIEFHLRADPRPVSELRPGVGPAIDELLLRCLAKEPDHRPAAADVAAALRRQESGGASAGPVRESASLADSPPSAAPPRTKTPPSIPMPITPPTPDLLGPTKHAFRLDILGSLDLRTGDGARVLSVVAQPKRVALLAYLAAGMGARFTRRDTIVGVFWPELDEERARHALRQALYVLRRALGPACLESRGDDDIRLNAGMVWCDAEAFERALAADRPDAAMELYQGMLLPGFFLPDAPEFEHWLEGERARLAHLATEAAWRLAAARETATDHTGAAHWARRAVALSTGDETAIRRLIELLDRIGDRAGALATYEAFARRLKDEMKAKPSPETQALVRRVRGSSEV